jgi:hypothetical protein
MFKQHLGRLGSINQSMNFLNNIFGRLGFNQSINQSINEMFKQHFGRLGFNNTSDQ